MTALCLEGGAMRGMFTCGILDVLLEEKVTFDAAFGISAGAAFGCNFKSRQAGRAIRYNVRFARDGRFQGLRALLSTGEWFPADFCYRQVPEVLDPFDSTAFAENPMHFYAGATDIATGACVFHDCETGDARDIAWMRASASMPILSRPVHLDGYALWDGGISCPVPFEEAARRGYDRRVLILTRPAGYRKTAPRFLPLLRVLLPHKKAMQHALSVRHTLYNTQMDAIDRLESEGQVLVLRPPQPLVMDRIDRNPDHLLSAYRIGRDTAWKRLAEIRAWIGG